MATVLLVRHGETAWNRDRRIQGWAETPLTQRGHEQAAAVGAHLAAEYDVDRVVASDLRRAKETTRTVARAVGVEASFDPGWRERNFGVYQGLSPGELFEAHPEYSLLEVGYAAAEATPEGGESMLDARERVLDAWTRLRADLDDAETVAVVAHGGPVRAVVSHLRGMDVLAALRDVEVRNCSVTEVAVDDRAELVRTCETVSPVGDVEAGDD